MGEQFMQFAAAHPYVTAAAIIAVSFILVPVFLLAAHYKYIFFEHGHRLSDEQYDAMKKRVEEKRFMQKKEMKIE